MFLSSYGPGDGSAHFVWVRDTERTGNVLDEPVTESDISEWLLIPENGKRFQDWDILRLVGTDGHGYPDFRLCHVVCRPFHTSKKLILDAETYCYVVHDKSDDDHFNVSNTDFYDEEDGVRSSVRKVVNLDIISALLFFLNHESEFEKNGIGTRRQFATR